VGLGSPAAVPARAALALLGCGGAAALAAAPWQQADVQDAAFRGWRVARRLWPVYVLAAVAAGSGFVAVLAGTGSIAVPQDSHAVAINAFGRGEEAFDQLTASSAGAQVALAVLGWAAVAWLALWAVFAAGLAVWSVRRAAWDGRLAVVFSVAALALASSALLVGGGAFIPAVTLAAGLLWGLLPGASGRTPRERSGWILLGLLAGLMIVLALTRFEGLAYWSAEAFELGEGGFLHATAGLLLGLTLAWLGGSRRVVWGVVALAAAAALGGAGEGLQYIASRRNAEWKDFFAHLAGCGVAAVLYLLVMAARWGESREPSGGDIGALPD